MLNAADGVFYALGSAERDGGDQRCLRRLPATPLQPLSLQAGPRRRLARGPPHIMDGLVPSRDRTPRRQRHSDSQRDFRHAPEWASTPGYRGCAFLNTAAEVAEIDDRHLQIIAAHKHGLVEYLAELTRRMAPAARSRSRPRSEFSSTERSFSRQSSARSTDPRGEHRRDATRQQLAIGRRCRGRAGIWEAAGGRSLSVVAGKVIVSVKKPPFVALSFCRLVASSAGGGRVCACLQQR